MTIHTLTDNSALHANPTAAFVHAMSRTVAGVSVVTTNGQHGRFGLTVSSMVSVSAEPPSLLFCVNRRSPACGAILDNGRFAINVLADHQQHIADSFSGRCNSPNDYHFSDREWLDLAELPRLRGASAFFACTLESAHDFGSHSIFVGRVKQTRARNDTPLLYTGRSYGRPERLN